MDIIQDSRIVTTKEQLTELLNIVSSRLDTVISTEVQNGVFRERKEAEAGVYDTLERQLEMLTHFSGISIGNVPGEDLNQRLKARDGLARAARNFLNSYDHYSRNQRGTAPNSDFDPKLMRIIVMAVRAHDAFEAARNDIIGALIIPEKQ